jgi:GNAT superfamily N-acetyltransferase
MEVVGALQDSYDKIPISSLSYNPSYYIKLYEICGFTKEKDMYELTADTQTLYRGIERKMVKITPFLEDQNIMARYFDRSNYERDSEIVRNLFHDSFRHHLGFYELGEREWKNFLDHYLEITQEDLFLIVEDAGEPIAFAIVFEDGNQKLHAKRHGYEEKVTRQRLDLIGVKPDYIRNGIGTYVVYNLLPGLQAHNTEEFSISWIFDDNLNSIGLCKSLGMHIDKTYRVYSKAL